MTYSRDPRRLPRYAVGERREPARYLVMMAHDPIFHSGDSPRVGPYPAKKVLGDSFLGTVRGLWFVVLTFDPPDGCYLIKRLVPIPVRWGQRPLDSMHTALREEANRIAREWNEVGVKPAPDRVFSTTCFTGRLRP